MAVVRFRWTLGNASCPRTLDTAPTRDRLAAAIAARSAAEAGGEGEEEASSSEEDVAEAVGARRPAVNPFLLLGGDGSSDDEGGADDNEAALAGPSDAVDAQREDGDDNDARAEKRRKKRARKKAAGKRRAVEACSASAPPEPEVDEVDAAVAALGLAPLGRRGAGDDGPTFPGGCADSEDDPNALLRIDVRRLCPDEELKRVFGPSVTSLTSTGPPSRQLRRGILVVPRASWPVAPPLLRLAAVPWPGAPTAAKADPADAEGALVVKEEDGSSPSSSTAPVVVPCALRRIRRFRFRASPEASALRALFVDVVQNTADPTALGLVLRQHPYQVDALLALSRAAQRQGDGEGSEDFLARALWSLEVAALASSGGRFRLGDPLVRLPGAWPENLPFHAAAFEHAMRLARRGCPATSLEVLKALLSLDRSDPVGCLQSVDYLALRCGQRRWLVRLAAEGPGADAEQGLHLAGGGDPEGDEAARSAGDGAADPAPRPWGVGDECCSLLPNLAFSAALAKHDAAREGTAPPGAAAGSPEARGPSGGDLAPAEGWGAGAGPATAEEHLAWAVVLHPAAAVVLVRWLREKGACRGGQWDAALARPPLAGAVEAVASRTLGHLGDLHAERCGPLWRSDEAQALLLSALGTAADAVEANATVNGAAAEDWAAVRDEVFPAGTGNALGHLVTEDFSEAGPAALPEDEGVREPGGPPAPAARALPAAALGAVELLRMMNPFYEG